MSIDYLATRPEASLDTECYPGYWSVGMKNLETGRHLILEQYEGHPLDRAKFKRMLQKFRIYTFNGKTYDELMIALAMKGVSNEMLKQCNDDIIQWRMSRWKVIEKYGLTIPDWLDHVDLFEPSPGVRLSLKKYGARMNMKRLAETPFSFNEFVTPERRPKIREYLINDLDTTGEMAIRMREEIGLRATISAEYGIDVRSKSDAQIAETLIKAEVLKKTGREVPKPVVKTMTFQYKAPAFIKFQTPQLQEVHRIVTSLPFNVKADNPDNKKVWGVVKLPAAIKDLKIRIGFTDYKMGIGGLHSKEKSRSFVADEDTAIIDRDVRAYYPRLMLGCGYVPQAVGQQFVPIFQRFVELRDVYKAQAAKLKAKGDITFKSFKRRSDSFKIVNNGTFGKTGSPYSVLYAPQLMIGTTLTGQLSLLMLVERLELAKFSVISANTDGIVTVVERERYGLFFDTCLQWELDTGLQMEEVRYAGVYSRDVNSYIALTVDENGKVVDAKRKGLFAKAGLFEKHDPTYDICSTAVVEYLMHGHDIEQTVRSCADITQFVGVKQVALPGGYYDGEPLGKMVRWYMGIGQRGFIAKADGSRVAGTTGCVPCMDLPDEFPDDVDLDWYVREAYARLDDIGLKVRDPKLMQRFGSMKAYLPGQKTLHIVDIQTRTSACERTEKKVREAWIEQAFVPEGMRVCKKCMDERGHVDEEVDDEIG